MSREIMKSQTVLSKELVWLPQGGQEDKFPGSILHATNDEYFLILYINHHNNKFRKVLSFYTV